jgi:hypothetical protein
MKARIGSGIVEENRSRKGVAKSSEKRHVEYSTIGCDVVIVFIIIFKMCRREGV